MNRRFVLTIIVIAVLVAGATAFAQQHRPYDQIMKDVGATFASLRKNLDASGGAAGGPAGGGRGAPPAPPAPQQGQPGVVVAWDPAIQAAAVEDAAKLERLFTEVEAFWAPFDTQDAVGFAKRARDAAAAIGTASKGTDIKAAQASVAVVQKSCANCHLSHREETGKGFLIKP